jgi:hypothetical protein
MSSDKLSRLEKVQKEALIKYNTAQEDFNNLDYYANVLEELENDILDKLSDAEYEYQCACFDIEEYHIPQKRIKINKDDNR